MSRLTCKCDGENVLRELCTFDRESNTEADDCFSCGEYCEDLVKDCGNCAIQRAFDKLSMYEQLEEQGLLKKFDCAIGDTVYRINILNEIYECTVQGIRQEFNTTSYFLHTDFNKGDYSIRVDSWFDRCQIGYEFYLTKEEAEQALKRLECAE